MIIRNVISGSLLFLGTSGIALADQVLSYKLTWDKTDQRYHVFMKPSETPAPNLTTTAQVTIKVPHLTGADRFDAKQITSAVPGTLWLGNSRIDAPEEDADFDYLSFSLTMLGGPSSFNWQKDVEIEVFNFVNAGSCTAPISLLNNQTDPFAVPNNSASTNPGNQFSNLGWGNVGENNYLDNYLAEADCREASSGNSGTEEPPVVVDPPADEPPVVVDPPAEEPPVVEPPVVVDPPEEKPPVDEPPVVVDPPEEKPPVDEPPVVVDPPAEEPPVVVDPPAEETPVTVENPEEKPTVDDETDPSVSEPPVQYDNTSDDTNADNNSGETDADQQAVNNPQDNQSSANDVTKVLDYKVAWSDSDNKYHVFMKPSATPSPDLTLTGQITLKVPHGTDNNHFTIGDLTSNIAGVTWVLASRVDAPIEDPKYDYLSFVFTSSSAQAFQWQANQEKDIFSFSNTASCTGDVLVMPTDDPFNIAQNSASTNPGNQFTNLGWGDASANNYHGNYGGVASACAIDTPDSSPADTTVLDYKLSWNQADGKYHVFMKPSVTPDPVDLSLTGQITLKVPHGEGNDKFQITNLQSTVAGTEWTLASHIAAPQEASNYDYLSFVVTINNPQAFQWQADQELEVFNFTNSAACIGDVAIMANDDPFNQPNNSASTNPGNQFTNLGWGESSTNNYNDTYGENQVSCTINSNDTDNDLIPDGIESDTEDRDNDGISDKNDFDPTGFFYCANTGKILTGGSIAVEGPGNVNIIANGSTGYYQFTMDTAGEYTMNVIPPANSTLSTQHPVNTAVLDPTGHNNPFVLGSGEYADTGKLSDTTPTAWFNHIIVEAGDPYVINNNIPLEGAACKDDIIDGGEGDGDNPDADHQYGFKAIPTLSEWAQILLALLVSLVAGRGLLRKN